MPDRSGAEPSSAQEPRRWPTRRDLLGGIAATGSGVAGGLTAGLAGCVTLGTMSHGGDAVDVLAAGSLQRALGEGLRDAVEVPITVEAHGSVTAARLVASRRRDPDIVALADTALFESLLDAPWHATIGTNSLVVAHADRPEPHPIATAGRWFEPILAGDVTLGRTDPTLDPLGYRTVFAADLGTAYYDYPGLDQSLLDVASIYPETSLVSRLEAGVVDSAVVYRSMATERGYPVVDLPAPIDLGDPDREYSVASYELQNGTTVHGAPIRYGAWARREDERVRRVFGTLADGAVLDEHGFGTPEPLPTGQGSVPDAFEV